jgi:hypothetical protein
LHQGAIEAIFLDAMAAKGLTVDRPTKPTSIELSQDEARLKDPNAYPVQVRNSLFTFFRSSNATQPTGGAETFGW